MVNKFFSLLSDRSFFFFLSFPVLFFKQNVKRVTEITCPLSTHLIFLGFRGIYVFKQNTVVVIFDSSSFLLLLLLLLRWSYSLFWEGFLSLIPICAALVLLLSGNSWHFSLDEWERSATKDFWLCFFFSPFKLTFFFLSRRRGNVSDNDQLPIWKFFE